MPPEFHFWAGVRLTGCCSANISSGALEHFGKVKEQPASQVNAELFFLSFSQERRRDGLTCTCTGNGYPTTSGQEADFLHLSWAIRWAESGLDTTLGVEMLNPGIWKSTDILSALQQDRSTISKLQAMGFKRKPQIRIKSLVKQLLNSIYMHGNYVSLHLQDLKSMQQLLPWAFFHTILLNFIIYASW